MRPSPNRSTALRPVDCLNWRGCGRGAGGWSSRSRPTADRVHCPCSCTSTAATPPPTSNTTCRWPRRGPVDEARDQGVHRRAGRAPARVMVPRQISSRQGEYAARYGGLELRRIGSRTSSSMRVRREGRHRRRARDNPAQRSGWMGRLLSRVRRSALRDSSRGAVVQGRRYRQPTIRRKDARSTAPARARSGERTRAAAPMPMIPQKLSPGRPRSSLPLPARSCSSCPQP